MEHKTTGRRIRRLREQRAWTQEHLADAAQVSVRTIQRAEDGVMSAETLSAVAGALDEPVEALSGRGSVYPTIAPVVYYDDAETLDWIVEVLGFATRMKIPGPDGRIMHAELTLGDGVVMVGAPMPSEHRHTPRQLDGRATMSLYVQVDDVDEHHARACEHGATVLDAPADAHGQRRYRLADPEGHHWWFFHML